MREPVKKRGGHTSRASLPSEKTLDHIPYMKATINTDMARRIPYTGLSDL
jgi:hypothetical protein